MVTEFPDRLDLNFRPHVGQFVLWVLLVHEMLLMRLDLPCAAGSRNNHATILSFLPTEILTSPFVFLCFRSLFLVAGILWILQLLLPISSWVCVIAYTICMGMIFENSSHISHTKNLSNIVLFVQALWYHFHASDIRNALGRNTFWVSRIYPGWVYTLSLFCVALYHSNAAIAKVLESGLRWPNGLSLQLWIELMGRENSLVNSVILSSRSVATLMQWGVLVVEASAILAVVFPRLRVAIGVAILCLYVGIADSFGYSFLLNAFLVAAFYFPWSGWIDSAFEIAERSPKLLITVAVGSRWEGILGFVVPRLDLFRMTKCSNE